MDSSVPRSSDKSSETVLNGGDHSVHRSRNILPRMSDSMMNEDENRENLWNGMINGLGYEDMERLKTSWNCKSGDCIDERIWPMKNQSWNGSGSDMTSTNSGTMLTAYTANDELECDKKRYTDDYLKGINLSRPCNVNGDISPFYYPYEHQNDEEEEENNTNSFLVNHPRFKDFSKEMIKVSNTATTSASSSSDIVQANAKPIVVTIQSDWNDENYENFNTISVKQYDKVELIARCDDWIYVKLNSNRNNKRFGWIPESTLAEAELISRGLFNNKHRIKSIR